MKYHEVVTKINRVFSGATRQQVPVATEYCSELIKRAFPFEPERISGMSINWIIAKTRRELWLYVEEKAIDLVKK